MKDNDEISISDLTHELSGTVYVFKGNLSEKNFLKYCMSYDPALTWTSEDD